MLNLQIGELNTVLCIGAHCDDIEIGCAGSLAGWASRYPSARFVWAVLSGDERRKAETRAAAAALLGSGIQLEIHPYGFRDGYFPTQYGEIKETLHALRSRLEPTLVMTHHQHDAHQDHRLLAELTWQTFRDHLVLEYEIPKYDGDLGRPNVFVPLSAQLARRKADILTRSFASQSDKPWFSADTFLGLMRLRGVECHSPSGFAEAFFARKLLLGA